MKKRMSRPVSALSFGFLFIFIAAGLLHAEEAQAPGSSAATQVLGQGGKTAAPAALPPGFRKKRENPLARFEIIAFGSLPLTLFYTNRAFEIYHWIDNGYASAYAPWPVSGTSVSGELELELTNLAIPERFCRLGTAAILSMAVAGLDAVIRHIQDAAEDKAESARWSALPPPPQAGGSPSLPSSGAESGSPSSE